MINWREDIEEAPCDGEIFLVQHRDKTICKAFRSFDGKFFRQLPYAEIFPDFWCELNSAPKKNTPLEKEIFETLDLLQEKFKKLPETIRKESWDFSETIEDLKSDFEARNKIKKLEEKIYKQIKGELIAVIRKYEGSKMDKNLEASINEEGFRILNEIVENRDRKYYVDMKLDKDNYLKAFILKSK